MDGKEIPPHICSDVLFTFKKECSGFLAENIFTMGAGGCNKHSLYCRSIAVEMDFFTKTWKQSVMWWTVTPTAHRLAKALLL